jgi:hypothetical protein
MVEQKLSRNRPPMKVATGLPLAIFGTVEGVPLTIWCNSSNDSGHDNAETSAENGNLSPLPVANPGEQRANHLTDLKDGENKASAGSTIASQIIICLVLRDGID